MFARLKNAENLGIREHRRDRIKAARERLTEKGYIGLDPLMFLGEKLPRAPKSGLDFIQDQRRAREASSRPAE